MRQGKMRQNMTAVQASVRDYNCYTPMCVAEQTLPCHNSIL